MGYNCMPNFTRVLAGFVFTQILAPELKADQSDSSSESAEIVSMEKFVVEASRVEGPPWRYAAIPGYEILSRCNDSETNDYLVALLRGNEVMKAMLPEGCLIDASYPSSIILYNGRPESEATASAISSTPKVAFDQPLWRSPDRSVDTPSSQAEDEDTNANCLELPPFKADVLGVKTGYPGMPGHVIPTFRFRLRHRVPSFPNWLIQGLIGSNGIFAHGQNLHWSEDAGDPTRIDIPTAQWVSDEETNFIRQNGRPTKPLLPMRSFFGAGSDATNGEVWRSQAALFVRWGMYGRAYKQNISPAAFWSFVNEATQDRITEAMFRQSFGFGYGEMDSRLRAILPKAVTEIVGEEIDIDLHPSAPQIRDARPEEIGRIIGDWERIKGEAMRSKNPDISREFMQEAGYNLLRARGDASKDPALAGVLGLYDYSIGADGKAFNLLEASSEGHIKRPMVYLRLAQLRYLRCDANPLGPSETFNADQVAYVLAPLTIARQQLPAMAGTYGMIAKTWERSAVRPTALNLAVLDEGERIFWNDPRLIASIQQAKAKLQKM
jgi:hypothetical protein